MSQTQFYLLYYVNSLHVFPYSNICLSEEFAFITEPLGNIKSLYGFPSKLPRSPLVALFSVLGNIVLIESIWTLTDIFSDIPENEIKRITSKIIIINFN